MSLGRNLQFLRKMHDGMTQEELAEKMAVSRQTISKWELDTACPEMDKLIELCQIFSCTLDQLIREDVAASGEMYSHMRIEDVDQFRYLRYAVISADPEGDAIQHIKRWAAACGVEEPELIGWDFPHVSQEQINVYHMHGYAAAWILPPDFDLPGKSAEIIVQNRQRYAALTVKDPFKAPFSVIPNAYKTLMSYMQMNGLQLKYEKEVLTCFERVYSQNGIEYMDVYIAVK